MTLEPGSTASGTVGPLSRKGDLLLSAGKSGGTAHVVSCVPSEEETFLLGGDRFL